MINFYNPKEDGFETTEGKTQFVEKELETTQKEQKTICSDVFYHTAKYIDPFTKDYKNLQLTSKSINKISKKAHPIFFIWDLIKRPLEQNLKEIPESYLKQLDSPEEIRKLLKLNSGVIPSLNFTWKEFKKLYNDPRFDQIVEILIKYFPFDSKTVQQNFNQLSWDQESESEISKMKLYEIAEKIELIKFIISSGFQGNTLVLNDSELKPYLKYLGAFYTLNTNKSFCDPLESLIEGYQKKDVYENDDKEIILAILKFYHSEINGIARNEYGSLIDPLLFNKDWLEILPERAVKSYPKDKEILLTILKKKPELLQYADKELRNDAEIILTAAKGSDNAFQFASEDLLKNIDFIKEAVKISVNVLKYVSLEQMSTKFIYEIVSKQGCALEFFPDNQYEELILAAIRQNPFSYTYVSKKFANDEVLISKMVETNGLVLRYLSEKHQDNITVVRKAILENPKAYCEASEKLKLDKEIASLALKMDGSLLEHAPIKIRNDKEMVLTAVNNNGLALNWASPGRQDDNKIVFAAIKNNRDASRFMSQRLQYMKFGKDKIIEEQFND